MQEQGFRRQAILAPNHLAIAAPDGRHWTRGELLAECERHRQVGSGIENVRGKSGKDGLSAIIAALSEGPDQDAAGRPAQQSLDAGRLKDINNLDIQAVDAIHFCTAPRQDSENLAWAVTLLHKGYSVVLADSWNVERLLRAIARYRVATLFIEQQQAHNLLSSGRSRASDYDVSSLRQILVETCDQLPDLHCALQAWFGFEKLTQKP